MFTVHVHAKNGLPLTENGYAAWHGFAQLGCHLRPFEDVDTLRRQLAVGDCVVGYIADALLALDHLDVPRPAAIDYPPELTPFYGRRLWTATLGSVADHPETWPVFVKSVDQKGFTGRVVASVKDLIGTAEQHRDRPVYCAGVVRLVSEWRGFVRYGRLLDVRRYAGRWDVFPDPAVLQAALAAWPAAPAGCSLDVGITAEGQTLVVECNDGFTLGHYGLNSLLYAKLISARWHQMTRRADPFRWS